MSIHHWGTMGTKKTFEPFLWRDLQPQPVIGVDEVGRGCLAGPVYAAAVILPPYFDTKGLTDSKLLSEKARETLSIQIHAHCLVGLGFATVQEIDEINILQASLLAMRRAIERLKQQTAYVIVDGNQKVPGIGFQQTTVIKGDLRAEPIAAASIVAKVYRDRLMKEMGEQHPGYGFENHKGYATGDHRRAIESLGPLPVHRHSFSGVKEYIR